jgi:site-specific recombinase XerD
MDISASIGEYLDSKQNSITAKTYEWYDAFLTTFKKWCDEQHLTDLSQITAPIVQRFVAACPTDSSNTRHHRAQVVKGFLNWCAKDEDMGILLKTVRRIEMPKTEQPDVSIFTEKEISRLIAACDQTRNPLRNKAILHVLLDTGIRASELAYDGDRPSEETGLRLENTVLGQGGESYIWVMGKGRTGHTVGIGNETTTAVRRYINRERGRSECPFLFLTRTGEEPLSVRMLQQTLDELGKAAEVDDCHPHRFRHTFAVNQLLNGTSSLILMHLMGHATLESTKIYARAVTQIQARKSAPSVVDTMRQPKAKRGWRNDR